MDDVDRMYRHLVRTIRATSPQLLTQPFQVADLYTTILPYRLHRRELGVETNQDYEMALLELLSGARGYLAVDDRMRSELGTALQSPNPDPSIIRNFGQSRVALGQEMLALLEERGGGAAASAASAPSDAAPPIRDVDTAPMRRTVPTSGAPAAAAAPATAPSPTNASAAEKVPLLAPMTTAATTRESPGAASSTAPRASGSMASAASAAAPARRAPRPITVSPTGEQCPHCKGELPAGREIVFCPHCGQDLTVLHCPACGSELEHGWKFCVTCGRAATGA